MKNYFSDFFQKPLSIVGAGDIRQGDFIHVLVDGTCPAEIEKRKGFVISVAWTLRYNRVQLQLANRRTPLRIPMQATAIVTKNDCWGGGSLWMTIEKRQNVFCLILAKRLR